MLNAFYVIYACSNENLEQHKRFWFLSNMANASLITHTDAAGIAFYNLACVDYTLCVYEQQMFCCVSIYTFLQAHLLLHCSTLDYEPKSNVLAHLIYYLFLFIINLVCFEACKGLIGCNFCMKLIMFSFGMLNIKIILYKQNDTLRLSLIERNNAKRNYQ